MIPKASPNLTLGMFFLIFCTPCFWWPAQCFSSILLVPPTLNDTKNTIKTKLKKHIFKHMFFLRKCENVQKMTSKRYQNRWLYFRVFLFGVSCGTFGTPISFFAQKVQPKCSKSDPKVAKVTPKEHPKLPKWVQNDPGFWKNVSEQNKTNCNSVRQKTNDATTNNNRNNNDNPGPADCAKRFE